MTRIIISYWLLAAICMVSAASFGKEENENTGAPEEVLEELDDEGILRLVDDNTINTAYYKDIFLDGGCELNPGNTGVLNGVPYEIVASW